MLLQVFIAVFDTNSWTPVVRVPTAARRLTQLSFEPDSQTLLAMSADGRLLRYHDITASGSRLPQCRRLDNSSGVYCVDTDGGFVAGGGNTGQLALYPLHWTVGHETPGMTCIGTAAGCSVFDTGVINSHTIDRTASTSRAPTQVFSSQCISSHSHRMTRQMQLPAMYFVGIAAPSQPSP